MLFTWVSGKFFKGLQSLNTDNSQNHKETLANFKEFFKAKLTGGKTDLTRKGEVDEPDIEPKTLDKFTGQEGVDRTSSMSELLDQRKRGEGPSMQASPVEGMTGDLKGKMKDVQDSAGGMLSGVGGFFKEQLAANDKMFEGLGGLNVFSSDKLMVGMETIKGQLSDGMTSLKEGASGIYKSMMKSKTMTKITGLLTKGFNAVTGAFKWIGKKLIKGAARLLMGAAGLLLGMIATVTSFIIATISMFAIPILVALIVIGLIVLGKYMMDNWETIKEKFSIAMEQLSIWASKAALWISNSMAPMSDNIRMFFAKIMDGLANMVNGAIDYINALQPDWMRKLRDGKDILDWRMDADNVENAESSAKIREGERAKAGDLIKQREADLADRRAALAGDQAVAKSGDSNTAVTTVNNNNQKKVIQVVDTTPNDRYAGMMAVAQ